MRGNGQIEYIYLCEECGDEKATTSTIAGPFEAAPSIYCPCTGELREMEPKKVGDGDSLSVGIAEEEDRNEVR